MHACRQKNEAAQLRTEIYGIVSNGQGLVFYRWKADDSEFGRTGIISVDAMPRLLGVIDHVCAACDAQVAAKPERV